MDIIILARPADYTVREHELADVADAALAEVERLKADVNYWSFCTWEGMILTCPEEEEVLRDRFANLNLSPWTFTEVNTI